MHGGYCTGYIRAIEPNAKNGIDVRVTVTHSDKQGGHSVFFNFYGQKCTDFRGANNKPPKFKVGDFISAKWEEIEKQKFNRETGRPEGWVKYKENIEFCLEISASGAAPAAKAAAKQVNATAPRNQQPAPVNQMGDDDEEW